MLSLNYKHLCLLLEVTCINIWEGLCCALQTSVLLYASICLLSVYGQPAYYKVVLNNQRLFGDSTVLRQPNISKEQTLVWYKKNGFTKKKISNTSFVLPQTR